MKLYCPITIDLYRVYPLQVMEAQQGNVGRGAMVTLTAGSAVIDPKDENVEVYAKTPDGTVSWLECSVEDGKIKIDFTNQMLMSPGILQVELRMKDDEDDITTPIFKVKVNKSNVQSAGRSENELPLLDQIKKNAEDAKAAAEAAEKAVGDKITNPGIGAVGQILEVESVDEKGKPLTYKAVDKPEEGVDKELSQIIHASKYGIVSDGFSDTVIVIGKDAAAGDVIKYVIEENSGDITVIYDNNDTGEFNITTIDHAGEAAGEKTLTAEKYCTYTFPSEMDVYLPFNIPAKTSQLTDDVGFAKQEEVGKLSEENAELKGDLVGEKNRAIARENEIEKLFTLPTQEAVNTWLDEHPEATTTVQDHSLTIDKMIVGTLGYVTPEMFGAIGDGVADDLTAIKNSVYSGYPVVFVKDKTYLVSNYLNLDSIDNIYIDGNGATIKLGISSLDENKKSEHSVVEISNCDKLILKNITIDANGEWCERPALEYGGDTSDSEKYSAFQSWETTRKVTFGGLRLNTVSDFTIENVKSENCRTGFYFSGICKNGIVKNSISRRTFADGVLVGGGDNGGSYNITVSEHYCEFTGDDCYSSDGYWEEEYKNPHHITFENCYAINCYGALCCAFNTSNCSWKNCHGENMKLRPFKALKTVFSSHDIKFEDCSVIISEHFERPSSSYDVGLTSSLTNNIVFDNIRIENNSGLNFAFTFSSDNLKVFHSIFKNVGFTVTNAPQNILIEDCELDLSDALTVLSADGLKISRCMISNDGSKANNRGYDCLLMSNCNNVNISKNNYTPYSDGYNINIYVTVEVSNYILDSEYYATSSSKKLITNIYTTDDFLNKSSAETIETTSGLTIIVRQENNIKVLYVNGNLTETLSKATALTLGTIQNNKPIHSVGCFVVTNSIGVISLINIRTDGSIKITPATADISAINTISFIVPFI